MKINRISGIVLYVAAALAVVLEGCSDGVITGRIHTNQAPEVWLSSGPVENDTTSYQVHFYWSGWDPDGELAGFEFVRTRAGRRSEAKKPDRLSDSIVRSM